MTIFGKTEARSFDVPLAKELLGAKHGGHSFLERVTTAVSPSESLHRMGYTFKCGKASHVVRAMIEHGLASFLIDLDKLVESVDRIKAGREQVGPIYTLMIDGDFSMSVG